MTTHSNIDLFRAYLRTASLATTAKAAFAVIAGCVLVGVLTLRLPEHRAYHVARVRHIGVRLGSKKPGVMFEAELADGRAVWLDSMRYNAGMREGARVCVQELADRLWGANHFRLALPSRCAAAVEP